MTRRRRTSTVEDLIELIAMMPWWVGVVLSLLSYAGLHAWANRIGASMAVGQAVSNALIYPLVHAAQYAHPIICLVGAALSAWRRHQRKSLADTVSAAKSKDVLSGISWREFEMLVGEGFRRKGYQVAEQGGSGPDGGVDLVLRKDGEKHLVQCKQWRAYKVGVTVVRELFGVMAATGADGGFVVTSGRFTDEARRFAEGRNVRLMDGEALFELIRSVRAPSPRAEAPEPTLRSGPASTSDAVAAPTCSRCAGPMVRRTARKGAHAGESFWGCAEFPKCRGTA